MEDKVVDRRSQETLPTPLREVVFWRHHIGQTGTSDNSPQGFFPGKEGGGEGCLGRHLPPREVVTWYTWDNVALTTSQKGALPEKYRTFARQAPRGRLLRRTIPTHNFPGGDNFSKEGIAYVPFISMQPPTLKLKFGIWELRGLVFILAYVRGTQTGNKIMVTLESENLEYLLIDKLF